MAQKHQAEQFHAGTMTDGWRWFGAHPTQRRGVKGWEFRVWAPHARGVSVVGDFNSWDQTAHPLKRNGQVWEGFLPELEQYTSYKYAVECSDGQWRLKSGP